MKVSPGLRNSAVLVLLALLAALCWLPGCLDNLCTKRLYIYRDAEAKSPPPADTALLIADPAIVAALAPEAAAKLPRGCLGRRNSLTMRQIVISSPSTGWTTIWFIRACA